MDYIPRLKLLSKWKKNHSTNESLLLNLPRNYSNNLETSISQKFNNFEFKNRHDINFHVEIMHSKKRTPRPFNHFPNIQTLNSPEKQFIQNRRYEFSTEVQSNLYEIINNAKEMLKLSENFKKIKMKQSHSKLNFKSHSKQNSLDLKKINFRKLNIINKYKSAVDNVSRMRSKSRLRALNSLISDSITKEEEDEIKELRKLRKNEKQKYVENLSNLSKMSNLQKKFDLDYNEKKGIISKTNSLFSKAKLREIVQNKDIHDEIFRFREKHNSIINITII